MSPQHRQLSQEALSSDGTVPSRFPLGDRKVPLCIHPTRDTALSTTGHDRAIQGALGGKDLDPTGKWALASLQLFGSSMFESVDGALGETELFP